jgi:hypothetical protein
MVALLCAGRSGQAIFGGLGGAVGRFSVSRAQVAVGPCRTLQQGVKFFHRVSDIAVVFVLT